jgi:hypothetical protein
MSLEQMAGQLAALGQLQSRLRSVGDVTSESGHVRKFLIDGPKTTEQLQELSGLAGRQIWGRLKYDLKQGRVERTACGKFKLAEIDQEAIAAAVRMLRRNGYSVTKIKRKTT